MIKTPLEVRALTHELSISVWTLSTIGFLLESDVASHLREPRTVIELAALCPALAPSRIERCLAVATAVGMTVAEGDRFRLADGAMPFAQPPMRASLQGDVRSVLMQALAFLDSGKVAAPHEGWRHTNPELLQAQGDASTSLVGMLKLNMLPTMGDLAARLEQPTARFLDVGVGVASLAIAMCRTFPNLEVVGVDRYDAPLSLARENVRRARLEERIDLRLLPVESLRDEEAFDLAWLPTFFVAEEVLARATERVHASLRPGGWILFPTGESPAANERERSVFGLVTHLWGGPSLTVERAESVLRSAGFASVRVIQGPVWAPALLVGQR